MILNFQSQVLNRSLAAANRAEADRPLVILVDDDDSLRGVARAHAVGRSRRHQLRLHARLARRRASGSARLPSRRRPDAGHERPGLQHTLTERGGAKLIVFLTAHGDIPMSVQAMKAGAAVDFLTKPAPTRHCWTRLQPALSATSSSGRAGGS